MGWEDEEDTTIYSTNLQKVLRLVKTDEKLVAAIKIDPKRALAPYKLTDREIKKVKETLGI